MSMSFVSHQKLMLALWNRVVRHASLRCYRSIPKIAQKSRPPKTNEKKMVQSKWHWIQNCVFVETINTKNIYSWKNKTNNLVPLKCPQNKQESNIMEPRFATTLRSRHPFRKSSMSSGHFEYKNANATMCSHFACNIWCPCKCNSSYKIWGNGRMFYFKHLGMIY